MPNVKAQMSNEIQSPNSKKEKWNDGTLEFYVDKKYFDFAHYSVIPAFPYSGFILLGFEL
jgi:hypothetical protein